MGADTPPPPPAVGRGWTRSSRARAWIKTSIWPLSYAFIQSHTSWKTLLEYSLIFGHTVMKHRVDVSSEYCPCTVTPVVGGMGTGFDMGTGFLYICGFWELVVLLSICLFSVFSLVLHSLYSHSFISISTCPFLHWIYIFSLLIPTSTYMAAEVLQLTSW